MLMGSYPVGEGPPVEALEGQTSAAMQDLILAYIKDPYNGPPSMGWPHYKPSEANGGTMLRFGADGKTVQQVAGRDVEGVCYGSGSYNPFPRV